MTSAPIVIFGTGRCGSTLLADLFTRHERIAWLSRLNILFPDRPGINRALLGALDLPLLGRRLRDVMRSSEAYPFHNRLHGGLGESVRDLGPRDVASSEVARIREAWLANRTRRRPRLLLKFAGWPRVGLVDRVLPDARFVHLVRDGRAVAASLLRMPWWRGWRGPDGWRFGPLGDADRAAWETSGRSFAVLAGLQWKVCLEAAEAAMAPLPPERLLQVRYEDLCAEPQRVIADLCRFLDLPRSPAFAAACEQMGVRPASTSWRRELDAADLAHLDRVLAAPLRRFGYAVDPTARPIEGTNAH